MKELQFQRGFSRKKDVRRRGWEGGGAQKKGGKPVPREQIERAFSRIFGGTLRRKKKGRRGENSSRGGGVGERERSSAL